MEGTFSGIMLRAFCGALGLQGVDVTSLLAELGVDRKALSEGEARIPARLAFEIFERAPRLTRDPAFGLHAALGMPVGLLEVLECAVREAGTAGAALTRVCRYFSFLDDSHRLEMRPAPAGWAVEARRREGGALTMPPVAAELLFAMIVARGRELTHTSMPLVEVGFSHAASHSSEHERFFGCPVRFGVATSHIVLDPAWLDTPIVEDVETRLGRLLSSGSPAASRGSSSGSSSGRASSRRSSGGGARLRLLPPGDGARLIRAALLEETRGEVPTPERIAARLSTTTEALAAALDEEGQPWEALREEARREIVTRCLTSTTLPASEIAFLAGFASAAAFEDDFARWAGTTPALWRARPVSARGEPQKKASREAEGRGAVEERKSGTRATGRGVAKRKIARRR